MSVVVVATIHPTPDGRADVIAAFEAAIPLVHAEPGCELYALHEGEDRVVVVEKWASAEDLSIHSRAAALAELGPKLAGKIVGAPDVQVLTPHPAGRPDLGKI